MNNKILLICGDKHRELPEVKMEFEIETTTNKEETVNILYFSSHKRIYHSLIENNFHFKTQKFFKLICDSTREIRRLI